MFHLHSRVHFYEIVVAVFVHQEFNCTGASVVDRSGYFESVVTDSLPLFLCYGKSRCEFDNLLVPSLYGAVSFIQVDQIAVFVAQHLDFYVFRPFDVLFDEHIIDSEGFLCFAFCASEFFSYLIRCPDDPHASSTAARGSFEHYRITAFRSDFFSFVFVFDVLIYSRNSRYTYFVSDQLRLYLVTQSLHHFVSRSDELYAGFCACFGECCVFGKESISRMYGVYTFCFGKIDDLVY